MAGPAPRCRLARREPARERAEALFALRSPFSLLSALPGLIRLIGPAGKHADLFAA